MNKKGFVLIEVIVGLVLLSLVTITCLPIFTGALNNLRQGKERTQMLLLAESTIEKINSFNYSVLDKDEYLFDMKIIELIEILKNESLIEIQLPLDVENTEFKYKATIHKENKSPNLWEINLKISLNEEGSKNNVNITTIIPPPSENKNIK